MESLIQVTINGKNKIPKSRISLMTDHNASIRYQSYLFFARENFSESTVTPLLRCPPSVQPVKMLERWLSKSFVKIKMYQNCSIMTQTFARNANTECGSRC